MLTVEPHPLLALRAFVTHFPRPLAEMSSEPDLLQLLAGQAPAPLGSSDAIRREVRDLLRSGGFKPTGRSKPASEYLLKAVEENLLSPINVAVDACNAVSLYSGLPISVVDLDKTRAPLRVAVAPPGSAYVFNLSGQTIDVGGLLCLFDADGPCGSAVKDSQRTKTGPDTQRTLSILWSPKSLAQHAAASEQWHHALLNAHGALTESIK